MKLVPPPSTKGRKPSHGSTSTQPTERVVSATSKEATADTSHQPHHQAPVADTQNPRQKTRRILMLSTDKLDETEVRDLSELGEYLGRMKWLSFASNEPNFALGVDRGGGNIAEATTDDPADYEGVIYYRVKPSRSTSPMVLLNGQDQLRMFMKHTKRELHLRGLTA